MSDKSTTGLSLDGQISVNRPELGLEVLDQLATPDQMELQHAHPHT